MTLWATQTRNSRGEETSGGWEYVTSECRDPQDTSTPAQRRTLTVTDVLNGIKRVGLPSAEVNAPGYTLVNLETTFFTEDTSFTRTLTIIGFTVEVQVNPSSYTWHWGDGTSTTTTTPGRPYPATDVTHTYVHATDRQHPNSLSVDVTYTAQYRVDGADWQTIPDTITVAGPATRLPIKQASSVLVAAD